MDESSEPDEVLPQVCQVLHQSAIDYFVHCVRHGKSKQALNSMIAEGVDQYLAEEWLKHVHNFIEQDVLKVQELKNQLSLSDDEIIELAETILRVYGRK
jgi:hypothetical protein